MSWRPLCLLLAISVAATWPGLVHGIVNGHDILNHVMWHNQFSIQFWHGEFYPRWLSDFYGGLGSPVFFFYGPVPFYIGAFISFFLGSVLPSAQQVALSAGISFFLSGLGAYCWLNHRFSRNMSLAGATFYIFMPYHLAVDFYLRFAYAEMWAMAFLPYLLLFVDRMIEGKAHGLIGLAFFYMLLIMTHLPTTLIFSPFLPIYAIVFAGPGLRLKVLLRVTGAIILGIGLSSVYFVPAMTLQHETHIHTMQSGGLYYARNFMFNHDIGGKGAWRRLNLIEAVTILTAGLVLITLAICWRRCKAALPAVLFWMGVACLALFMMLPVSNPLWNLLPVLKKVQFPWRFHTLLNISTIALLVQAVQALKSRGGRSVWLGWAFAGLALASMLISIAAFPFLAGPRFNRSLVSKAGFSEIQRSVLEHNHGSLEHVPIYAHQKRIKEAVFAMKHYGIMEGTGTAAILTWEPRKIVLEVNAHTDLTMWVKQFYFPGWRACTLEDNTALSVFPVEKWGLLGLCVPEGQHTVDIDLEPNHSEIFGWLASGVCLFGVFLYFLSPAERKGRIAPVEPGSSPMGR
jgi:hypothetical protein